jgi:hypothetical protein
MDQILDPQLSLFLVLQKLLTIFKAREKAVRLNMFDLLIKLACSERKYIVYVISKAPDLN